MVPRWATSGITFLIFFVNAVATCSEYFGATDKNIWLLVKMLALISASIAILIQGVIINRNQQNFGDGLQKGHAQMQVAWMEVSRRFESAENAVIDTLIDGDAERHAHARMAIDRLMAALASTVIAVFNELPKSSLTVTLGIPTSDGKHITIVEMLHEADGRRRGQVYEVPDDINSCVSMSSAFRNKQSVYTPDTHLLPELSHKRYRSILSIPIFGAGDNVIGIVNVDTSMVSAFGKADPDNPQIASVVTLSLPILRAFAHLILSADAYSRYAHI